MNDTGFSEIQRFSQRWLWIVLIVSMLIPAAVFAYGMIEQLVYGKPWGDRPVSDLTLILIGTAVLVFSFVMIYLFYSLRLITEVHSDGIYIRFFPFPGKKIAFIDIKTCEARTYRPLAEYGGWGIKYGRSGWAYTILGDRGVQLVLHNDKRILIGSQLAEQLTSAILDGLHRH